MAQDPLGDLHSFRVTLTSLHSNDTSVLLTQYLREGYGSYTAHQGACVVLGTLVHEPSVSQGYAGKPACPSERDRPNQDQQLSSWQLLLRDKFITPNSYGQRMIAHSLPFEHQSHVKKGVIIFGPRSLMIADPVSTTPRRVIHPSAAKALLGCIHLPMFSFQEHCSVYSLRGTE